MKMKIPVNNATDEVGFAGTLVYTDFLRACIVGDV